MLSTTANAELGDARRAFIARSVAGMNLSDRVWQSTRQLRDEMEVAITAAIGSGTSAASLSRQVRKYLNDPDLMFRRFRYKDSKTGEWRRKWKKRVIDPNTGKVTFIDYDKDSYRDQWTGRGYYKSAAQNAMRVARTETNIAYRRADNARWQQLDFVIGQRVQLSRSHPCPDICDELAGDYPKDFVFDGWHPQCFCFVTPINLDADTIAEIMSHDDWESEMKRIADSKRIKDYPANFKSWVTKNADNIAAARARGTEPYFVRNNAGVIDNILNPDAKPVAQSQGLPQNAHDLIDHLRTNGNLDESYKGGLSERDIYRKWDSLTDEERLQVLERGRYTGMLSTEEDLDFANLYQPASRDNMLGALQDELENKRLGFDVEDTNHYIIKFKGNDAIVHSFDLEKPLTAAQIKRVEYISANAGMSNYRYWAANDDAKAALMREMRFVEYENGVVVDSHKLNETSKIEKGLKTARKSLIRQNREVMMILDNNGNPIESISGAARSVHFDDETAALVKNRVVTHNHPSGKNATGAQSFGYSLSFEDLIEAFKCDMRGIVAESPIYRYAIERPANGWNIDVKQFRAEYEKIRDEIIADYAEILDRHQADNIVQHLVLKRLSKQYDFVYRYTRL